MIFQIHQGFLICHLHVEILNIGCYWIWCNIFIFFLILVDNIFPHSINIWVNIGSPCLQPRPSLKSLIKFLCLCLTGHSNILKSCNPGTDRRTKVKIIECILYKFPSCVYRLKICHKLYHRKIIIFCIIY